MSHSYRQVICDVRKQEIRTSSGFAVDTECRSIRVMSSYVSCRSGARKFSAYRIHRQNFDDRDRDGDFAA
jgi:hypothetical protein